MDRSTILHTSIPCVITTLTELSLLPVPSVGLHCRCLVRRFNGALSDLFCVRSNDTMMSILIWKRRKKGESQYDMRSCSATRENREKMS